MSIAPYERETNGVTALTVAPAPQVSAVAQLVEWAHGAQAAYEVAENLVNTSFCPAHYRGKPHEATAAILAGLEVGLSPMASLQAFHSIQGQAAPKAVTLRAIVQSRGHHMDLVESSATRVVMVGRRAGATREQRVEWTIERARLAGFPKKNPNWGTQPEAMLIARCSSELARLIASDAILGIPYSVEELTDGAAAVQAVAEQSPSPSPSVAARRRNAVSVLAAAEQAGDVPPHTATEVAAAAASVGEPVPGSGRIDPKGHQMQRLTALYAEKGITDREEAIAVAAEVVGRPIGSSKDLTYAEAARVIARLEQMPAAQGGES